MIEPDKKLVDNAVRDALYKVDKIRNLIESIDSDNLDKVLSDLIRGIDYLRNYGLSELKNLALMKLYINELADVALTKLTGLIYCKDKEYHNCIYKIHEVQLIDKLIKLTWNELYYDGVFEYIEHVDWYDLSDWSECVRLVDFSKQFYSEDQEVAKKAWDELKYGFDRD